MPKIAVAHLFLAYQIAARKRSEIAASLYRNEKAEGNYGQELVIAANTEELLSNCDLEIDAPKEAYESIMGEPEIEAAVKSRQ